MKILLLNTNNPFIASGSVAYDLFNKFLEHGNEVRLLVNSYSADYPAGIVSMETRSSARLSNAFNIVKWKWEKLLLLLKLEKKNHTDPNYHFHELSEDKRMYSTEKILERVDFRPDVVILLFIKNFINSRNIREIHEKTGVPILWVMYDMAPFTGGCHYAWTCDGYLNSCGSCPGLHSSDPYDITYQNLRFKQNQIGGVNLHIICGSEWQFRQARASTLFRDLPVHKFLYPVDSSVFKPVDKRETRIRLGVDPDKRIVFFGSTELHHLRKGMTVLLECLKILKSKIAGTDLETRILLLVAGQGIENLRDSLPFEYHYMGYVDNKTGIASAYQAADVYVCPSIEDSGPTMINQSVLCGTPVVAFTMGVAPDLVLNGKTGYMAELGNAEDLAQGIFEILSLGTAGYDNLARQCRDTGYRLMHDKDFATKLLSVVQP